jgi:peptide deformylase
MAILPVLTVPNPILKQKSSPVESVDNQVRKLMDDLLETMYADNGVGLAAAQVGILKRVLVIDLQDDDDLERPNGFYPLFVANPEIIEKSNELAVANEGCLSVPEQKIEVARPSAIKVRFLGYKNNQQEFAADGWLARAIQHEVDHLNGKLLIDYLSPIKRDVTMRKLTKLKKHCL